MIGIGRSVEAATGYELPAQPFGAAGMLPYRGGRVYRMQRRRAAGHRL